MARTKKTVEETKTAESMIPEKEIEWNGVKIHVKKYIPVANAFYITKMVSETAFTDDGDYRPDARMAAWKSAIISSFSDYSIPEEMEALYELCYGTDLYAIVLKTVEELNGGERSEQIGDMLRAIQEMESYTIKRRENELNSKISEVTASLTSISNQLGETFGGVSKEDVAGVMKALSGGKLDESKIVEAILKNKKNEDSNGK